MRQWDCREEASVKIKMTSSITPRGEIESSVHGQKARPSAANLLALIHAAQAAIFAAALATGILLFSPTLRAIVTSGYSALIGDAHRYCGRAQVLLALVLAGIWLRAPGSQRLPVAADRWRAWRL